MLECSTERVAGEVYAYTRGLGSMTIGILGKKMWGPLCGLSLAMFLGSNWFFWLGIVGGDNVIAQEIKTGFSARVRGGGSAHHS